jgi:hypothetical protein
LRSPYAEQFALQLQRELRTDWLFSLGYVGTKGTALFQQVDVNPTIPGTGGQRVDSGAGVRCAATAPSIYHCCKPAQKYITISQLRLTIPEHVH